MDLLNTSQSTRHDAAKAGLAKRLGAVAVDTILVGLATTGILVVGFFVILIATWGDDDMNTVLWFLCLGTALLVAAYYLFFWTTSGATPGKSATGIRVISWGTGRAPSLRQAAVRYAVFGGGPALISLVALATGSIWGWLGTLWFLVDNVPLFFDPWHRALHDRAADTVVVLDPPIG